MKKVLIIDDSTIMRKMMKNILSKLGHDVVGEAVNGRIGVEKYQELNPDVVTMDFIMDEMDGLEALNCIMGINPDANVIMVSSMGQEVVVHDAIILGAKNFLVKPFNEQQVQSAFERL